MYTVYVCTYISYIHIIYHIYTVYEPPVDMVGGREKKKPVSRRRTRVIPFRLAESGAVGDHDPVAMAVA
jgi:hypothetical protein